MLWLGRRSIQQLAILALDEGDCEPVVISVPAHIKTNVTLVFVCSAGHLELA